MRIDKLELINFKNFDELSINFQPGVNLFVGSNGSGKTSILEAINVAAGCFFASQESKLQRPIFFDEIKITKGKREPIATVKAQSNDLNLEWSRSMKRDTKANDTKGTNEIATYGEHIFIAFDLPDTDIIAPLIAFYSTQRLFKDANLSGKQKYDPAAGRRNGYLQCLKNNAIKGVLNEWLGNAVTRRATEAIKSIDKTDFVLENVEQAIIKTLVLFMDLPDELAIKIYQDPDLDNELFIYIDEDHDLPLSYYSDGFRNLVYLVIDLMWRASQLNPLLTLTEIANTVDGIVSIDEIDLHLHPRWQAKAIEILQLLFPKVQFFITTHSPTVVANFQNGTLYEIDNNIITRYPNDFFGKTINSILKRVLGAADRHVPTQRKLDKLFVLIDENLPDQYTPLLNELTELLSEVDPDIQKALALIEMQNLTNAD